MYEILYADDVVEEFQRLRARDRSLIVDRIKEQLRHEPTKSTRMKKLISGLRAPWLVGRPIWQLRVGQHRVFYDVDETLQQVMVRAIRRKPPHKTTEQIL
jgi:mRNA-degrading endonuclease RelE of RelBE toxin-antitoxin system